MNKIYDLINEASNGRYKNVRFSRAELKNGTVTVTVVALLEEVDGLRKTSNELLRLIENICGFNSNLVVAIESEDTTVLGIRNKVASFTKRFPYLSAVTDDMEVKTDPLTVKIKMHSSMYSLAKDDFFPRLEEFLKNAFVSEIKVEHETYDYKPEQKQQSYVSKSPEFFEVTVKPPVFGEPVTVDKARSAADINANTDDVAVCGILTMPTDFMSKGGGAKRSRPYEKFLLYVGNTTLQCRCFPKDDGALTKSGLVNTPVVVFGNAELERGRTGEYSLTARSLCPCDAKGLKQIKSPKEPKNYSMIRPSAYEEYVQATLFGGEDVLPDSLKGTFVAFDFETTGLSILYDKPTELGAVKIVDGVIVETFSTLIDPERSIPEEVSKKTGITDDMVKGKPKIQDVLPDFYKFTYGHALVGHNVAFDFPFLIKYGNMYGYPFGDRRTFDTLGMAPRAIPGIDVLTLDRTLESLGLTNDNAHRALSDATATAKAFIAMSKILSR